MDRRQVVLGGLAAPLAVATAARGEGGRPGGEGPAIPIADMHAHLFFIGPSPAAKRPLGPAMASGGATLVAWSLVGDLPWLGRGPRGLTQKGTPAKGAATAWFLDELARAKRHIAEQGLKIALTPADVDKAVAGEPHVVLAVEGASFLDDGIEGLQVAFDGGVRHVQLVHYIRNALGDFQTERPHHHGLTELGKEVVRQCNRLGVLVDLAHATDAAVGQALAISRVPMVWSHGSVTRDARPSWKLAATAARRLPLETARAIAAKGGVIGLWGLRSDVGATVDGYARRIEEMAAWLGAEHVAFGSDLNVLAASPLASFADLRRVVDDLARNGMAAEALQAIAIGNYARVLKQAMEQARS